MKILARAGKPASHRGGSREETLAIAAAVLVASAACSAGDDRVEPTPPDTTPTTVGEGDTGGATADQDGDSVIDIGEDDVVLTAGLVRFGGCGPLIDYLHTEYLARVESEAFDDEAPGRTPGGSDAPASTASTSPATRLTTSPPARSWA